MQIVLASSSPRRQELLRQVEVQFLVDPSHLNEEVEEPLAPAELVERLALQKASEVATRHPGQIVLGADTIVVVDGEILGKPRDRQQAIQMLTRLGGRSHQVMTGVALVQDGRQMVAHEETVVQFGPLTQEQIERYVDTGEPMDKAGAYGIQGRASALIESIQGDYFNVVGLPLYRTIQMLTKFSAPTL